MEEVDSIIIHFFRQLNINIDDDVKNICDLRVETIIESASKCLTTINPSLKVPTKLPSGISQRIEVAAQIASLCKDLGYKNDVGYQTFLYYNEAELRQVFMFLIEQLPSEGKQATSHEPANNRSLLMRNISAKIGEELNSIWIPPCCKLPLKKSVGDFYIPSVSHVNKFTLTDEEMIKRLKKIKIINARNAKSVPVQNKESHPAGYEEGSMEKTVNKCQINKSLKELKEISIVLRHKLDTLESERNIMDVEYSQACKACSRAEADLKNVQNILRSIGISNIDSIDATDNVLEKVHLNIALLHKKSEDLTSRNLSIKANIEKLRSNLAATEPERSQYNKILTTLKADATVMKEEFEKKGEIKNQLMKNYDRIKGANKRSIYTKRILEIISNVDKQNLEIQKILEDTRVLQKEINTLEGQLDRCFSIADETLFRDAKKDDQAKKAYKLLALLHSECNTIVSLVNDTGSIARDIVDLEDNIKAETSKRTEDTLKKIHLDLTTMQDE